MADKPGGKADRHHGETIVKKGGKKHHDEAHGGAWKVAFADFCLALLCLFLVLWLMAAREQEHIEMIMRAPGGSRMDDGAGYMPETLGGLRGSMIEHLPMPRQEMSLEDHKPDAAASGVKASGKDSSGKESSGTESTGKGFASKESSGKESGGKESGNKDSGERQASAPRVRYDSQDDLQSLARVLARMSAEAGLASNLQTVVTPYGLRVMLHDTDRQGMFERGSSVPSDRFQKLLARMGPLFAQMDNQMLIVGHTDSVKFPGAGLGLVSNWGLSSNRAMTARAHLIGGGMSANSILQVVGMADRAPLDVENATAAMNRRIELLVLTTPQARTIATMFGMPTSRQALVDGVDTALPDSGALQALRSQIGMPKRSN